MITGLKLGESTDGNAANAELYRCTVVSLSDYYPFGMEIEGRTFVDANAYRYGFGGQEKDLEVGSGIYTAEYWEYDSKLCRRWNVDPVIKHHESPYSTFANNPIWLADPNGLDTFRVNFSGKITQKIGGEQHVYFYTDKDGAEHNLGAFDFNENDYIQLKDYAYKDASLKFGFTLKGNGDNAYVSPQAFASFLGALADNKISDQTVISASTSNGSSPSPSSSHLLGQTFDLRYLRKDKSGERVNIWESQVDFTRETSLIKSLSKYGFTSFLSEHTSTYEEPVLYSPKPFNTGVPTFIDIYKLKMQTVERTHKLPMTTHYAKEGQGIIIICMLEVNGLVKCNTIRI